MKYQDPRAEQIVSEINEARKAIPYDSIVFPGLTYNELPEVEVALCFDIKMSYVEISSKRREEIWHKQIVNNISGICWIETEFCGKSITLPRLTKNLVLLPGDKEIITASKDEAIAWIKDAVVGFKIWRTDNDNVVKYTWEDFLDVANGVEWVELSAHDSIETVSDMESNEEYDTPILGLHVSLCWGMPGHYFRLDITPGSGSILFQFANEVVL